MHLPPQIKVYENNESEERHEDHESKQSHEGQEGQTSHTNDAHTLQMLDAVMMELQQLVVEDAGRFELEESNRLKADELETEDDRLKAEREANSTAKKKRMKRGGRKERETEEQQKLRQAMQPWGLVLSRGQRPPVLEKCLMQEVRHTEWQ